MFEIQNNNNFVQQKILSDLTCSIFDEAANWRPSLSQLFRRVHKEISVYTRVMDHPRIKLRHGFKLENIIHAF